MQKHLLTLGIWALASLLLAGLYWSSAPNTSTTPSFLAVERGRTLFLAKGCATCHSHVSVSNEAVSFDVGPNLSVSRADPAFLRRWLADPQSVRPNTRMPNLQLKPDEIDALIAFLSADPP
jgi:cytochrome c oxidase subunit II